MVKSLAAALATLLLIPLLVTASHPQRRGLRIGDGRLVTADGAPLILRGAAHGHLWYRDRTATAIGDLAMLGANAVRVMLSGRVSGQQPAGEVRGIVRECRANRVICVLSNQDTTGYGERPGAWPLERAAGFWLEVREALAGHEDYVILNVGDEPFGNTDVSGWTASTVAAVHRLRAGGLRHVLMVDAPNWGQDWRFVMRDNAPAVMRADPLRNMLFSVHMYGVFKEAATIRSYVDSFTDRGLALVIGAFGPHHPAGAADVEAILSSGIGYLAGIWSGAGPGEDLAGDFHPYRLTAWGRRFFASPAAKIPPGGLRGNGSPIGFAALAGPLARDPAYRFRAAREFNAVTTENSAKWDTLQPAPGDYRFDDTDRVVAFARAYAMTVHGHTLVWHLQTPQWVRALEPRALRRAMHDHITAVAGRYAHDPQVRSWDVVNEPIGDEPAGDGGRLRDSFWLRSLGPGYVAEAFHAAKAADPDATLCLNEYGAEGIGAKSDALHALTAQLRAAGVPVECVGFQGHLSVSEPFPEGMRRNLQRFEDLGVQVRISELDVRVPLPATAQALQTQARYYELIVQACREVKACTGITLWGLSDRHSWVPSQFGGEGAALPFDEHYRPKARLCAAFAGQS